jgi:hypothetical protein
MSRTVRAKITTYVQPDLAAWLKSQLASSDHNRETVSSLVEGYIERERARDTRHGQPTRKAHGAARRAL